jgi:DNA-binding beta-propeller fold protein YncE
MPGEDRSPKAPSGICVDEVGRVLVADTHESQVVGFDRDGRELFRFGKRGMGPGQFMLPTDVAVDSRGFIYVSEYGGNDRISKFDPQGGYLFSFGDLASGVAMLQRPSGLAVDEMDRLWVADTGNHRICCFDGDGQLLGSFGELGTDPGYLRYPRDVVLLPQAQLAVVDRGNNRISFFDRDGRFVRCWGHSGSGLAELNSPENATAADGLVVVADTKNHRLLRAGRGEGAIPTAVIATADSKLVVEGG